MTQPTKKRLPKGWKIYSIEASDGKRVRSIDYELSKGVSPERAVKEIIEMVRLG